MSTNRILQGGILDVDVEMIINNPKAPRGSYSYEAVLSSPKADYKIPILKNLEWKRDFNSGTCEDLRLIFVMDGAIYRNNFHQVQDHLEVTINKKNGDLIVDSTRYKFIILNSSARDKKELMNTLTDAQLSSFIPILLFRYSDLRKNSSFCVRRLSMSVISSSERKKTAPFSVLSTSAEGPSFLKMLFSILPCLALSS